MELLVLLVLGALFALFASVVGAFLLQMTVWTFNKLIGDPGPPRSMPVPSFWQAVAIMAALSVFHTPLTLVDRQSMMWQLAALAVSCIVTTVIFKSMLPTTYLRATVLMVLTSVIGFAPDLAAAGRHARRLAAV